MEKNAFNQVLDTLTEENIEATAAKILEEMDKGKSLHEAAGITVSMQEEIYVIAHDYYEQGRYNESLALFQMLARINPNSFRFIYGLAASYHQIKDFINASLGFFTALSLEPFNPMPAFYLADCFLNLESPEDASRFLDITIAICEEDRSGEYKKLMERCKLIRTSLKSKIKPKK